MRNIKIIILGEKCLFYISRILCKIFSDLEFNFFNFRIMFGNEK